VTAAGIVPYPIVDPVLLDLGPIALRWYGLSYVAAFVAARLVLGWLAKRDRWVVPVERVWDVLLWGIFGVFVGGRAGYLLFYAPPKSFGDVFKVWEGGMAFHGGLLGVILAYWIFALATRTRFRDVADGLALATPPGIFFVRVANFVNAELHGRPWDGPWAMRFPEYEIGQPWNGEFDDVARHPSALYEALGEGPLLFAVLWWLAVRRGWGGGRVACAFLVGYGLVRFAIEFFREPDRQLGFQALGLTRGQNFSLAMVVAGLVFYVALRPRRRGRDAHEPVGLVDPLAAPEAPPA
jgi:phosphatidylglycerol:prolipoprotein diacylglycerol transferase